MPYKVVIRFKKKLVSPWTIGAFELQYKPKSWTLPKVGLLFYCEDLKKAVYYGTEYRHNIIVGKFPISVEIWEANIGETTTLEFGVPKFFKDWTTFWTEKQYLVSSENRIMEDDILYCTDKIMLTKRIQTL